MSTSKHIDKICISAVIFALIITIFFINAEKLGVQAVSAPVGYESRLFNTSNVHSIDIVMDDWDSFIENCTDESYETCAVIIDGEAYKNVGIRAKGNTSLSSVAAYGNDRYSFKIEFDHYDNTNSYYGLDKLCLNNIIQDNTYMKDYLAYQMMRAAGADAPLCSYAYVTVNGEDWGLYLAVEGIEEAFLQRNYGNDYGELYKPDTSNMGGGRGNGKHFDLENEMQENANDSAEQIPEEPDSSGSQMPKLAERLDDSGNQMPEVPEKPDGSGNQIPESAERPDNFDNHPPKIPENFGNKNDGFMNDARGSSDVSLIYTDDEYESYSNIFDNAKTDISDNDKDRLISSLKQLSEGNNIENIVDIEEVIKYFVVHNFVLNFDSYTGSLIHNYYLYEKDGKLSMIPWDYNLSFNGFMSELDATSLVNYPIDTPILGGSIDSRPMLAWIFNNEEYTELYHQYFAEFISEYFDSGYFADMFDSVSEMIAPYVEKDPTKFCTYEEFKESIPTLREVCLLRAQSITAQLNGSIPSTSDEQSQDSSTLIDASHLNISSMGSTGNGMRHGEAGGRNERGMNGKNNEHNKSWEKDDFIPDDSKSP